MITATWTSKTGWGAPSLIPYGPLALQPHASVLHYATTCFEGMKFYRGHDLKLRLFRPSLNATRMLNSSARISLPAFPPAELQKLIEILVAVEGEKWLPKSRPGSFMYLRPTMIGTEATLGVQKPNEVLLYIIACCFPDFNDPAATLGAHATNSESHNAKETKPSGLKLFASKEDTIRAWPGGFGFAKVGANYGPSLLASDEAHLRGFNQILWLFGPDSEITEAGASNFFLVWKTKEGGKVQLVTAPLGDQIILPGVTRRSVLELARERIGGEELEVVERKVCMWELEEAVREGRLMEAFAAGTAVGSPPFSPPLSPFYLSIHSSPRPNLHPPGKQYFIMPISLIHYRGTDLHLPVADDNYGSRLKQWLVDIMYGNESHEWGVVVEEERSIQTFLG